MLLLRGGENPAATSALEEVASSSSSGTTTGGSVNAPPSTSSTGPIQGKAIGPIRPGLYPDFVGADLASALSVLYDNEMNFVIVEVYSGETPAGLVMNQSPDPGTEASDDSAITLTVSKGAANSP